MPLRQVPNSDADPRCGSVPIPDATESDAAAGDGRVDTDAQEVPAPGPFDPLPCGGVGENGGRAAASSAGISDSNRHQASGIGRRSQRWRNSSGIARQTRSGPGALRFGAGHRCGGRHHPVGCPPGVEQEGLRVRSHRTRPGRGRPLTDALVGPGDSAATTLMGTTAEGSAHERIAEHGATRSVPLSV